MNKKTFSLFRLTFPLACFIFLFISCDILRDFPFEVISWTPGEGYFNNPNNINISLLFSHEPDKARTELSFNFTEDGKSIKGDFEWIGQRLIFYPASLLEEGKDYVISLGIGAQNTYGLSLENKFEARFTTRPPGERPEIIETIPANGGYVLHSRGEVRFFFSERVSLDNCLDLISFSPASPGSWTLDDGGLAAVFVPREPWQTGILYRLRVDENLTGNEYNSYFSSGEDLERPHLLKINVLSVKNDVREIIEEIPFDIITPFTHGFIIENEFYEWENHFVLEFIFSEPVELNGLGSLLVTEPSVSLVLESGDLFSDRAVFRFAENPSWGSSFLFRFLPGIKDAAGNAGTDEYLFRIICNGSMSREPVLKGIRIPMAPGVIGNNGNENYLPRIYTPESLFNDLPIEIGEGYYPYFEDTPSWIELYFECAPGTEIDLFSVMELFRVESTNQALTFWPRRILISDFSWEIPIEGWENYQRIEIQGYLVNSIYSGIVTFRIAPGLKDGFGNRSSTDFRISLLK